MSEPPSDGIEPSGEAVRGRLRIDPHIHTLASDGVSDVETILAAAVERDLDAIAITDHERIDAAVAARDIASGRGLSLEVVIGEEISTRGGHLLGLWLRTRIRPWHSLKRSIAMVHEQGGVAIIAHPLPPYPLCASERAIRNLMDEADPIYHPDGLEGFNPTTARMRWSRRAPALAEELGIAAVAGSDAHHADKVGTAATLFRGASAADLRTALAARDTAWDGRAYTWQEQLRMFGQQQRKNAAAVRDEVRGRARRDGTGRDLGYPGGRLRPVRFDRLGAGLEDEGSMKIGLVTPYIFPLPGGVNAHVGYLYENLVRRGHDVRIISSTHGPQRSSEGDIIRLGYGWSVPTNGSIGTLTVSHRYGQLVTEMLDRERFDVIHFHEPFVPFLSLQILRHSRSVNIATFHAYSGFSPSYEFGQRMMKRFAKRLHGRIAVSAAARHFIGRFFPGEYKVIPNGVDLAQFADVPPFARWRDGIPNILFVGRFESRKGLMYLLRAYYQLRLEGLGCRLLIVGHGPQIGEVRRYVSSRRLGGVELLGRLSEHDKARAFATADIYASPATGQESFGIVLLEAMAAGVPIVCSDIHGYKGVVRRNEQAVLVPPRDVEGLAMALGTLLRDPLMRQRMGESGEARAQQFGWEAVTARVEDYYRFVIRRLAAAEALPPGFSAPVPEAPVRSSASPGLWSSRPEAGRPGAPDREAGGPGAPDREAGTAS